MERSRAFTGNRYRSAAALSEWHSASREMPLEPDLAIVDAHHHLWPDGDHAYGLADFRGDCAGLNVIGSVFVECSANYEATLRYGDDFDPDDPSHDLPVRETRFVAQVAADDAATDEAGLCGAIVGFVDLQQGEARAQERLETHIEAGEGRFRGIRQSAAWDAATPALNWRSPPPGLLLHDRFQSGFAALKNLGLSFDAWLYYPQLLDLVLLARRFPDVTIVLNHFGGIIGMEPHDRWKAEGFRQWRRYIEELALCPNVIMKMGGLGMPAARFDFHLRETPPGSAELAELWRPWIECSVEAFGAGRCMIGSNFPVERQCAEYATLWNAYKIATKACSPDERAAIFSGTARRAYRLDDRALTNRSDGAALAARMGGR